MSGADAEAALRASLRQEAQGALALAERLRAIGVEDAQGVEAAERALRLHAERLCAIADAAREGATREAFEAQRAACIALGESLEAMARALEGEQAARVLGRLRLGEALRDLAHDAESEARLSAEAHTLTDQIEALRADLRSQGEALATARAEAALQEAASRREIEAREAALAQHRDTIARLEATLAEAGHRLVTRVGELASRHPLVAATLRAPVRLASRLLGRRGP